MLTTIVIAVAVGLIAAAVLIGRREPRVPVGWMRVEAVYDGSVALEDGEHRFDRLRFWYTDVSGSRHCTGVTLSEGLDFYLGQVVPIAVSPDSSRAVVLHKAASAARYRPILILAGIWLLTLYFVGRSL